MNPVEVCGADIVGMMNGKRIFQFKEIGKNDEWFKSLSKDLKKKCGEVSTILKTMV